MNAKVRLPEVARVDLSTLEPAAIRVLIAKDAIALLEARLLEGKKGKYIDLELFNTGSTQLHEVIEEHLSAGDSCAVCALGAALVAAVRRFDDLSVAAVAGEGDGLYVEGRPVIVKYLERFFSKKQLYLMELAFEGNTHSHMLDDRDKIWSSKLDHTDDPSVSAAYIFHDRSVPGLQHARAVGIFQNIVEHNGEFVP